MRIWFSGPRIFGVRTGVSFRADGGQRSHGQAWSGGGPIGCVYVIKGEHGMVKIGHSNNPPHRLGNLQTGSPFRLYLTNIIPIYSGSAKDVEAEAHLILDRHRGNGEWFSVSPEMAVAAIYAAADRAGVSLVSVSAEPSEQRWQDIPITVVLDKLAKSLFLCFALFLTFLLLAPPSVADAFEAFLESLHK